MDASFTESKDLLQTVFDSAPNGIAVMRPVYNEKGRVEDFEILLFNAYTFNWIGDVDYKGKRYGNVFPMVRETGILERFTAVAETGITAAFECWYTGEGMNHCFCFTAVKQGDLLVVTTEDITKRKLAETALKKALEAAEKQKRLYDSVINNTPDLVYVFDLDYRFTYANKALLGMWGKTAEKAFGKGLRENGYEEWHAQMHEREIDEVVTLKKTIRGTVSFPHAELGTRIYDYIFAPVFDEAGDVEAIAGTTRDITELKQAEESLRKSEGRFRTLVQDASVAIIVVTGPEMRVEIVNEAYGQLIGRTVNELLGYQLFSVIPDAEDFFRPLLDGVRLSGKPVHLYDTPYTVKTGSHLIEGFLNVVYQPYGDIDGRITGVMVLCQDVTGSVKVRKALEESENRFRLLSDEMPQFVWTGDANGHLGYFNQAVYDYSGLSKEHIANGGWIQIVHPDDREENIHLWQQSIATGEDFIFEHRFKRADGEYRWQLSRAVPQRDAQGVIQQWIGTSTDIQDQKNINEQLENLVAERTKELKRSNEDLQQFAHVTSHDLREPVRKIKMFTGKLEQRLEGRLDETETTYIEKIQVATNRIFNMIDGVLAYSTINAAMQKPEAVDLNDVVKSVETDLEVALQNAGAVIRYHELPVLEGAPVLLYQLFYNLVNNSVKFAQAGVPPEITITSEAFDEDAKSFARLVLQDNGIGFEPKYVEQIFQTFVRLHSKDKYEGTGLGLSLCKKIAERHGGSITASGTPGKGATFTITLPMHQKLLGI